MQLQCYVIRLKSSLNETNEKRNIRNGASRIDFTGYVTSEPIKKYGQVALRKISGCPLPAGWDSWRCVRQRWSKPLLLLVQWPMVCWRPDQPAFASPPCPPINTRFAGSVISNTCCTHAAGLSLNWNSTRYTFAFSGLNVLITGPQL